VEHRGHPAHRLLDRLLVGQVPADDLEAPVPLGEVEVGPAPGGEVVEYPDALALREEALDDVRADEARAAGDQVYR
jgi:hypothetical protein